MKSKDKKNPDCRAENPYGNNRKRVEDRNEGKAHFRKLICEKNHKTEGKRSKK
jgi:hypothetical protein